MDAKTPAAKPMKGNRRFVNGLFTLTLPDGRTFDLRKSEDVPAASMKRSSPK